MSLPSPSASARALVTGASQGIGRAIARDLAKLGHSVILVARREQVLQDFAAELASRYGVTAEVRACDLSEPSSLSDSIKQYRAAWSVSFRYSASACLCRCSYRVWGRQLACVASPASSGNASEGSSAQGDSSERSLASAAESSGVSSAA